MAPWKNGSPARNIAGPTTKSGAFTRKWAATTASAFRFFARDTGNRILRNSLDRVFDGICLGDYKTESLDNPLIDPDHGRGTVIADNLIENTRDSGIELGVGCIDVNVHHNTLRRTHGGLRFKVPRIGPVFIHHNRLIDGAPFNIWFSMDASPAEGYVYHNTSRRRRLCGARVFLFQLPSAISAHRSGISSTTSCCPRKVSLTTIATLLRRTLLPRTTSSPVRVGPGQATRHATAAAATVPSIEHDVNGRPAPGSVAHEAGLDLSGYRRDKPLPGCEAGYFQGKAPDVGADLTERP